MEEVENKLGGIEKYLQGRYYPFILEEISDFYDRIQSIYLRSNSMSELLKYINDQNKRITESQTQIGKNMSQDEMESLISNINDKINEYESLEKMVIQDTDALYNDVETCIQGCENDVKNSVIPLSEKEAEAILKKQNTVINDLQQEINSYKQRAEEIQLKISKIQEKNRMNGKNQEPVSPKEYESTKESLLWLYSLKRIINHSVGIVDIVGDDSSIRVQFKNQSILHIECDRDENTVNAQLQPGEQDALITSFVQLQQEFETILSNCIGDHWSVLTTNVLYLLHSVNHLSEEIHAINCNHVIHLNHNREVQIIFTNYVTIDLLLPPHYPRTMEKVVVKSISTSDIDKSNVDSIKDLLRNKQFFSLSDFVDFVEQNMFN